MPPGFFLFFANVIAGLHAVLIFYFLFGWLMPFMSFPRRALLNSLIAGSFLFFRFMGGCPLTSWEARLRALADPYTRYGFSFIDRNLTVVGIHVRESTIDTASLVLNIVILCVAIYILLHYTIIMRSKLSPQKTQ